MVASVSSNTLATDTAFSSATRTDLGRIDDARLDEVDIFLASRVEAVVALPLQHAGDHDAAIDGGILRDLPRRRFERALQDLHARPFITALRLLAATASMQRSSASPPPGTIPSATAALVALIASSSASFFDFISARTGRRRGSPQRRRRASPAAPRSFSRS